MQNQEINSLETKESQKNGGTTNPFSIRDFLDACYHNWYWFVISLVICVGVAFIYSKSQTNKYKAFAYILIKSDSRSGEISDNALFGDLVANRSQSIENEIYILKSSPLIKQVVERLTLDATYYIKPNLRLVNIYRNNPIEVKFLNEIHKGRRINMEIDLISDDKYIFRFPDKDDGEWKYASYGAKVTSSEGVFVVSKTPMFGVNEDMKELYVNICSVEDKVSSVWDNLTVRKADAQTNVLALEYDSDNFKMSCEILDNLIDVYNQDAIADKNRIARNTESFILDRINALGKDLGGIDGRLEQIKISGNMPDITSAATRMAAASDQYNADLVDLETQVALIEYMRSYLKDENNKNELIPANIGISDAGISGLIGQYNEAQMKYSKLIAGSGSENPWAIEQEKTLNTLHANIVHSIDNLYNSLAIKQRQARAQKNLAKRRMSSATSQEKVVNDVLRQQKIKEELYLYLLNKREENALRLAITEPNAKVIEKGGGDEVIIYPQPQRILMMGFAVGLLIPALIIYFIFWLRSLDTKIHNRADIEDLTQIPILGEVPMKKKSQEGQEIIVTETGHDRISEAMRLIRSNFEWIYTQKEGEGVVVQLTSTIPGEGKSYVAANLALSFAQMGKKVLAIDFDLRKGKFSKLIGARLHRGLSSYLAGRTDDIDEIIQIGELHPNLSTIGLVAVPPNPANLLMGERYTKLIDELKKRYDYIFLDTVPYNIVADAALINRKVDVTIYVIRANMLDKRFIPTIERMYNENKINNLCFLLTDVNVTARRYGYGYSYGYGYGYGYGGYGYGYIDGEDGKKE